MKSNRLERKNGWVGGVCGGIAAFLGWNPFIIRLIFLFLLIPGGVPGIIPYVLLWIFMPRAR